MPHKNQMLGLMKLALDRTSNTINLIFDYAIGAAIFGAVFILTSGMQFVNLRTWVNTDVEEGLRWIDSEFTGVVNPKDRHYRDELGLTESKKKKGAHDTVSDKIIRSLW